MARVAAIRKVSGRAALSGATITSRPLIGSVRSSVTIATLVAAVVTSAGVGARVDGWRRVP